MKRNLTRILAVLIACLLLANEFPQTVFASTTGTSLIDAQKKVWNIINTYADPDYFLEDVYHYRTNLIGKKEMTDAQYKELRQAALKATKKCTTQYEKIQAITEFVANRVYYDYQYYYDKTNHTTYIKPYDVYQYKRATCSGYTSLTTTLLVSIGIPCMELYSYNHTYNAAYDSTSQRWIFIDTTWCSNNRYGHPGDSKKHHTQKASLSWFDKTPEELGADLSHCVYWVDGLTDRKNNSAYYRLCTGHDSFYDYYTGWKDVDTWYLSIAGARKNNLKAVAGFAGLEVRSVQCDPRQRGMIKDDNTLKTVDLSATNISSIEGKSFERCRALTSVTFPSSLTTIETSAFAYCNKLKEINLSGTKVSSIGYSAFLGCNAAKMILLPSTVKTINDGAFLCSASSSVKTTVITPLSKKKLGLAENQKKIWGGRSVTLNRNVYTIEFIGNKATSGQMSKTLCGRGVQMKLPANQFKRSGYTFTGWSTKKNGKGTLYKDKASIKNLAKKNKTVKLYAQWKKNKK
ncbi:MAG: leucine-rich repeat protein [Roseburia sp.]|nr:leucine-rich repeat protein [Roseburia sp.]